MLDIVGGKQRSLESELDDWIRMFQLVWHAILLLIRWPWMLAWDAPKDADDLGATGWRQYCALCILGMLAQEAAIAGAVRLAHFPESSPLLTQYLLWEGLVFFALLTMVRVVLWAKHAMR
jgi:hypothetical protein